MLSIGILFRLNVINNLLNPYQNDQANAPDFIENISIDDDPYIGTKGAPVTIVEFMDYQCPSCANSESMLKELLAQYQGKIVLVYRDFPLEQIHSFAFQAAEAVNCAKEQGKFWEMHTLLFSNQEHLEIQDLKLYASQLDLNIPNFNDCLDKHKYVDEIRNDMKDGAKYFVTSTPTFFINGNRVEGGNIDQIKQKIELVLTK